MSYKMSYRYGVLGDKVPKTRVYGVAESAAVYGAPVSKQVARGSAKGAAGGVMPPPSYRGAEMVTAFIDARGQVSVDQVAERFGMSKGQLAEMIGLKAET